MDPALPKPKDHAEAVAVFRAQIIGPALARSLARGKLAVLLRELASEEYVPPGAKRRHRFGTSTLERWYYAYRRGGLKALRQYRDDLTTAVKNLGDGGAAEIVVLGAMFVTEIWSRPARSCPRSRSWASR